MSAKRHPALTALARGLRVASVLVVGCSPSYDGIFKRLTATESFYPKSVTSSTVEVTIPGVGNGSTDILWVVDNSGSMSGSQAKIAAGFESFAQKYLGPSKDIRLAVITTDAFLAGDPSANSGKYGANNGADYARLLPGTHDGVRPNVNSGTRSGMPILSTRPPKGVPGDAAWTNQLISQFYLNAKPGITGSGDERGMQSVVKLMMDNELRPDSLCQSNTPASNCFFRKGSARAIIFLSDETDSSRFPGATTQEAVAAYAKNYFDSFFRALDESGSNASPNYFIVGIINQTLAAGASCSLTICSGDTATSQPTNVITFNPVPQQGSSCSQASVCAWGKEYQILVNAMVGDSVNLLAKNSAIKDINSSSYDALLDSLGQTLEQTTVTNTVTRTVFQLAHPPSFGYNVSIVIVKANGDRTLVPPADYAIVGSQLQITLSDFPNSLDAADRIEISYTPKSVLDRR